MQLVDELEPNTIIDLGCGTGLLTRELVKDGRRVIGIDPSAQMLEHGKQQPGAEKIEWILGDSGQLGQLFVDSESTADLAIMTSNVAQVFLDDGEWQATLNNLAKALKPGGTLAFESRNPVTKGLSLIHI